ncbi:MAG TPA: ATP-binding cassette domain-containing protein, partial [Thermomicrobiales bacterium]|nr:ATP-binding cassette domain-containing protein [Thermomicrobiales bacterium]
EHWALLGPNGAGKTTLLNVATARRYPSRGLVEVLGRSFGSSSMLELREQIAIVDPHQRMYDWFTTLEIVLTGTRGTIQPDPDGYSPSELKRAHQLMQQMGLGTMTEREIGTCSQGERQRVRIARALMQSPRVVVLDEPALGLDLPAREALIDALVDLAREHPDLAMIMISHHLEELPPTITHAALLRDGRMVASGPVESTLTGAMMSATYGIPIEVSNDRGRWLARGRSSWDGGTGRS